MILEIDVGNTLLKWRIASADEVVARGRCATPRLASDLPADWPDAVQQVRISNVAGREVERLLQAYSKSRWGLVPVVARTVACEAGVTNSYAEPSRMGVDRWLAMLAAYRRAQGACCVVDCGSAITVDYLADDGVHQGGFIIPGLRLMSESLQVNTADVLVDRNLSGFDVSPGTHTSAAVVHGINFAFQALQEKILAGLNSESSRAALYITGGDGDLFYQLAGEGELVPELVMDGLACI